MQGYMSGQRLSFVVRPISGTVQRKVTMYEKDKGLVTKLVTEPGGFMVYFPRGHCLRLTEKQLAHYGLNKPPTFTNMGEVTDPNSPAGQLLTAQNNEARAAAFSAFETHVIKLATQKTGPRVLSRIDNAA